LVEENNTLIDWKKTVSKAVNTFEIEQNRGDANLIDVQTNDDKNSKYEYFSNRKRSDSSCSSSPGEDISEGLELQRLAIDLFYERNMVKYLGGWMWLKIWRGSIKLKGRVLGNGKRYSGMRGLRLEIRSALIDGDTNIEVDANDWDEDEL
jgi:hypothetical protein